MPRPPRRFAPAVAPLEDRVTPAVHLWDGGGTPDTWSDNANWTNDVGPTVSETNVVIVFNSDVPTSIQDIPGLTVQTLRFDVGAAVGLQLQTNLILDGGAATTIVDRTGGNKITGAGDLVLAGATATFLVDPTTGQLTISTDIIGTQGFRKTGTGTLEFAGTPTNKYAGVTRIDAGELFLNTNSPDAAVSNTVFVGDGTGSARTAVLRLVNTFEIPDSASVTVEDDGLVNVTGTPVEDIQSLTLNGGLVTIATGATFRLFGPTVTTGPSASASKISGTGVLNLTVPTTFTVADGAASKDLQVDALVFDFGGTTGVIKNGPGRMVLTAANNYGPTTVNAGVLEINGDQPAGTVTVTGGTFSGTGTVGPLTATGGAVAPGGGAGVTGARLRAGNTTLTDATFRSRLFGPGDDPAVQFNTNLLAVAGTLTLDNATLVVTRAGTAPAPGRPFQLISNDGTDAVVGTFNGLPEGATFSATGQQFRITYAGGDGNDVVLIAGNLDPVADQPPVPADDDAFTRPGTPITIAVLANDRDPDGDQLTVTEVTPPANGTAALNPDGTVTYTPAAGYLGADSFTYTVSDGRGETATATVIITVSEGPLPNQPPVAAADSAATAAVTEVRINVLANDTDINGDRLTVAVLPADQAANGFARVNDDGTVTYLPNAGFVGTDAFTYTVDDGQGGTATARVTVTVAAPVVGLPRQIGVGLDRGGDGTARLVNADQFQRYSVDPFPGTPGGVRTAAADFNGDGIADLVVGTGPGVGSLVRVLDGQTQQELFVIAPFEGTFTGGVYVAAGDLNGDGVADLVITPDEGGGPRVRIFSGKGFGQIADFFGIADPTFRGGARAAVGDLNGDGVGDLLVAAGFGGGPRVAGFSGRSLGSGAPARLFADFFAFEPGLRNGVFLAGGDINGDGFGELIVGGGPGGGPRVRAFDGKALVQGGAQVDAANFFAGDSSRRGGVRVAVKDLDGDNLADLVVGAGPDGGSRVTAYAGKSIRPNRTPQELFGFDAQPGFAGGVFVG